MGAYCVIVKNYRETISPMASLGRSCGRGGQRTGAEFRRVQHRSSELEGGTQLGRGGREECGAGLEI